MTTTISTSTSRELQKLTQKWEKAKSKLQQAQAKELNLRLQINAILAKNNTNQMVTESHDHLRMITFKRNKNFSIPKASSIVIRTELGHDTFDTLFNSSYSLKKAVYQALETDGKTKKLIDKHLTIKDAPLSVTIKDIE